MIQLDNVTKFFKTEGEKKYIFKNVTLTIPSGVNLGILGGNGAGKSTFLRMLGGIDFPTSGRITSDTSFSWPMGLSSGFQPSMTGRQNVKFVARIYGKTDEEIDRVIESVKEFAEIGDYFDMPVKTYSSGMRSRVSFGLSLAFDFDYLIIDETLAVGDENFKHKAKDALAQKIETTNILLVSHSMPTLKSLCNAGVVLHQGEITYFDKIDDAIDYYHRLNQKDGAESSVPVKQGGRIYCEDGNVFEDVNEAARFYRVRPMSILQALNQNDGSNVYLQKVFWREGEQQRLFQPWENAVENETIISSDGVIFADAEEATKFYIERFPEQSIEADHVQNMMQTQEKFSKKLNIKFHYLSEYQGG
jgi:capsular polysaccharide transport system ATP-binding protein